MRKSLCTASLFSFLIAGGALAEEQPKLEIAPVLGAQFFRGINGPGFGEDQGLQNGAVLGAHGGALFGDQLRLGVGVEMVPTMAVGIDRLTYVLHPHFDLSIDASTGWIRPYIGVGVGLMGFVDNEWATTSVGELFGETKAGVNPDVEFSGEVLGGVRFYMGEMVDVLEDTVIRIDVRDIMYAPRNGTVNYVLAKPAQLVAFHNPQFTLSFAWIFDAFGEQETGDYYEGKGTFQFR